jgi:hypothetical protein
LEPIPSCRKPSAIPRPIESPLPQRTGSRFDARLLMTSGWPCNRSPALWYASDPPQGSIRSRPKPTIAGLPRVPCLAGIRFPIPSYRDSWRSCFIL